MTITHLERKIRENCYGSSINIIIYYVDNEPTVPMNKLLQTRTGDTFPIYVGDGIEVLIEDQLVFLSELGELSGQYIFLEYQAKNYK